MINVLSGNILNTKCDAIVNTVNCVGVMGKGLALTIKDKYPNTYKKYVEDCKNGVVIIGRLTIYKENNKLIINFPTKLHWRYRSEIEYIEKGLDYFAGNCNTWGVQSVAFPALGCGLGGLEWNDVNNLLLKKLKDVNLYIEIYEPL